jgi:signal transduction protein with GAF and PtsI domain
MGDTSAGGDDVLDESVREVASEPFADRTANEEEASAVQRRMRARVDRLAEGLERLAETVRLARPEGRELVLRQGIVDTVWAALRVGRVSLMLLEPTGNELCVVSARGMDIAPERASTRKIGEGPSGLSFRSGRVLCLTGAEEKLAAGAGRRWKGRRQAFACVPLICLGVRVGVLCLTEAVEEEVLRPEEAGLLRLMGMQVAELLAADPTVERLLEREQGLDVEDPRMPPTFSSGVGDAELARRVCEAVASEVEPSRVLGAALAAVSDRLCAAPVALHLRSRDGARMHLEAGLDGGVSTDRVELPCDRGLLAAVLETGCPIVTDSPGDDRRFDPSVDTAADGRLRAALFVPIRLKGQIVGVLRAFPGEGGVASFETAEMLSSAFSAAVRNVLLYRSLLQSIEEVAAARRSARGLAGVGPPS